MDKLIRLTILLLATLLVSCGPEKAPDLPVPEVPPVVVPPTPNEKLFPVPFFPLRELQIEGRAVSEYSADWTAACLYTETLLSEQQKAWISQLEPAGGEGKVAPRFTQDFDGDGRQETVSYGAYAKASGEEGNFLLVTKEGTDKPQVLLLKELSGPPQFTVFTLKPDLSLWFGGGIDAGEVTMRVTWEKGTPVLSNLTEE